MKKLTKVQIVQNIAIYKEGSLDFYAKSDVGTNNSKLIAYYEEAMKDGPFTVENMFISSYSKFWETKYGEKELMPMNLSELQRMMDEEYDQIIPLSTEGFSKLEF